MKKVFFVLIAFLIEFAYSQDISGTWHWENNNKLDMTEIVFVKIDSVNFKGRFCSVFDSGKKIDCDDDLTVTNITLKKISKDTFIGNLISNYSHCKSKLKLRYLEASSEILLELINESKCEFYFPKKAIFYK